MNLGIIAAIAYGILAIVGGIQGYMKAQSKISLMAGVGIGILLILGGILQLQGYFSALVFSMVVATFLMVVFVGRLIKTRKFMPAGLMIIAGLIAVALMGYQLNLILSSAVA